MLNELKDQIAASLDVTDFLDILGFELADILDKFDDEIAENQEAFRRAVE